MLDDGLRYTHEITSVGSVASFFYPEVEIMPKKNPYLIPIILVAALVVTSIFFFARTPDNPGTVVVKDEVPADWSGSNLCTAREGILVGMCCTTWDVVEKAEIKIDCAQLVENSNLQAFLTVGGDKLSKLSSIAFVFRVQNTGNTDTSFRINSIDVTSTNGDQAGIDEIKSRLNSVIGTWKSAKAGGFADFQMSFENRIRLDIPEGDDAFIMKSGIYTIKINIDAIDEYAQTIPAGFRTVDLLVEQETIAFNVEVIPS